MSVKIFRAPSNDGSGRHVAMTGRPSKLKSYRMTLGEHIWNHAIHTVDCRGIDAASLLALGEIVVRQIDANFADIDRDHAGAIAELDRRE